MSAHEISRQFLSLTDEYCHSVITLAARSIYLQNEVSSIGDPG